MRWSTDEVETHSDSAASSSSCDPFSLRVVFHHDNLCFHSSIACYNGYHILVFIYTHAMRITSTLWH
ncbi:hypothetical protein E2C01_081401 [Portunus trituberculatus]|uniref:Uncharacterized protein n=1 Tax=Portunus trituberculatus TaxID=210409 RepID=A0A5B7J116_PORTR|nr:hypothetical protein [Portunus trituberculatus]